jgi:hypothetical protein
MKIAVADGTDVLVGWAEVPRAAVPGVVDYWTSSSTVGKDKVLVIHDPTAIYGMPALEDVASLSASLVGRFSNVRVAGSGTSLKQYADANATAATPGEAQFFVTGVDLIEKTVYVRINPHHVA